MVPAMWLSPPFSYSVMEILVPGNSALILACSRARSLIGSHSTSFVIQEFSVNLRVPVQVQWSACEAFELAMKSIQVNHDLSESGRIVAPGS